MIHETVVEGLRLAAVLFVSIVATAVVAGVAIHYLWGAIGLIPASGASGGTAPSGYTTYLNAAFTVVFPAQVYVTYWAGPDDVQPTPDTHSG